MFFYLSTADNDPVWSLIWFHVQVSCKRSDHILSQTWSLVTSLDELAGKFTEPELVIVPVRTKLCNLSMAECCAVFKYRINS